MIVIYYPLTLPVLRFVHGHLHACDISPCLSPTQRWSDLSCATHWINQPPVSIPTLDFYENGSTKNPLCTAELLFCPTTLPLLSLSATRFNSICFVGKKCHIKRCLDVFKTLKVRKPVQINLNRLDLVKLDHFDKLNLLISTSMFALA